MRLVKPGFEVMAASGHPELPFDYTRPLELIEAAGRTCYKSEDKVWTICPDCGGTGFIEPPPPDCDSEDDALREFGCGTCDGGKWKSSAAKFVDMLEKRGHFAMLEHSWVCGIDIDCAFEGDYPSPFLQQGTPAFGTPGADLPLIAGNLRAFADYHDCQVSELLPFDTWLDGIVATYKLDAKHAWLCAMTVRIVCDRGVTHEIVRHRPASYAQESTRYCNYTHGRFGGQVTFVIPPWIKGIKPGPAPDHDSLIGDPWAETWLNSIFLAENAYFSLLNDGQKPEQARAVLPNSLKTEIVVTASLEEWQHIFKLRCAPAAHPQMREIMVPLQAEARRLFPGVFGEA